MPNIYAKTFRYEEDLRDQIRTAADQAGLTESEWIRRALRYALTVKAPNMTITTTQKVEL